MQVGIRIPTPYIHILTFSSSDIGHSPATTCWNATAAAASVAPPATYSHCNGLWDMLELLWVSTTCVEKWKGTKNEEKGAKKLGCAHMVKRGVTRWYLPLQVICVGSTGVKILAALKGVQGCCQPQRAALNAIMDFFYKSAGVLLAFTLSSQQVRLQVGTVRQSCKDME